MSGILYGGQLNTKLSVGGMILNDYRLTVEEIDGGYRLIVTRGSEVQTLDIMHGKDGDGPSLSIDPTLSNSGEAADAKVVGDRIAELLEALSNKVDSEEGKGLSSNDFTDELLEKLNALSFIYNDGSVKTISVAGNAIELINGVADIPLASETTAGVVKSSNGENGIKVNTDGTMTVNQISFDMITQSDDDQTVIVTGGSATF